MFKPVLFMLILIFSCSLLADSKMPPLKKIDANIEFHDDLSFEHMLQAISRQERYFSKTDLNVKFKQVFE